MKRELIKKNEKKKETNVGGIKWIKRVKKKCHDRGCSAAEGRFNLR